MSDKNTRDLGDEEVGEGEGSEAGEGTGEMERNATMFHSFSYK